ncbi:copper amine oxidase N-terminal domain-containing protein [Paenibacillus solani]|uniref:copper amine oxidase N-terminal domain-containing protein n=1 Tax=Paenibacillus solani TaxID=1705565 RepID=UPI003D2E4A8D
MRTGKWTKKVASSAVALTMLMSTMAHASAAPKQEIQLNINHWMVTLDVDYAIKDQTTLVPLQAMKYYLESMGLHWNNKTKTVTISTGADQVVLEMGSQKAKGDSKVYSLSTPAYLKNGHVMVPIRFIADLYDAQAGWDKKERMVYLYMPKVDVSTSEENGYVKLYPFKVTKYGRYEGMVVEVEGRKRVFKEWHGGDGTRKPIVHYQDVTGDGKPEVVVFYVNGTGTGLYMGEMHVVDAETLKEIPIESLEQAVSTYVQSSIKKYADHFLVKVTIDGKESVQRFEDDSEDKGYLYDKVGFGAVVNHSLVNGRLQTTAAGSISPAGFAGEIKMTYRFQEDLNQFVVDTIEYSLSDEGR